MVQISPSWPTLSSPGLNLYFATDPLLSHTPTLIFHGPSITTNSTLNSSRIQALILTPYGFQCFPRITVSPNSSLYAAVRCLPQYQQGDDICRGLAVSLLKYFSDIPEGVRNTLIKSMASSHLKSNIRASGIFGELHAGDVVSKMAQVHNVAEVTRDIQAALEARSISNVDLDLVLPSGSVREIGQAEGIQEGVEDWETHVLHQKYGDLAPLVSLFGTTTFIPTSRIRRAPSRPTTLNRSKSLMKKQEDSIKREIDELIDTEDRYINRLRVLVEGMAKDVIPGTSNLQTQALKRLFPSSLTAMLEMNEGFLYAIISALDTSANDLDAAEGSDGSQNVHRGLDHRLSRRDSTGAVALSKVMLEWFPKFESCYGDYMKASGEHSSILNNILKDGDDTTAQKIRQFGEQHLRSMLIEPVQRLPRYSLFIDNIATQLPITNPALQPLLRCRDIITTICCLESSTSTRQSQISSRLRNLVSGWPSSLEPTGRLISTADVTELDPPFRVDIPAGLVGDSILLLFADCLVTVRKGPNCPLSARGVMAEIDRPSVQTMAASFNAATGASLGPLPLAFGSCIPLKDVQCNESNANSVFWQIVPSVVKGSGEYGPEKAVERAFYLHGPLEGKANRLTEDIAKARIESRFSEKKRESGQWELRTVHNPETSLALFSSIFEGKPKDEGEKQSRICIVVNDEQRFADLKLDEEALHIAISVVTLEDATYHLELRGLNAFASSDVIRPNDLVPLLCQRLGQSFSQQRKPFTSAFLLSKMVANRRILQSISVKLDSQAEQPKARGLRPHSPVKMLSNFLSGTQNRDLPSPQKPRNALMENAPKMKPSSRDGQGHDGQKKVADQTGAGSVTIVSSTNDTVHSTPIQRLEETFAIYIMALHGRRGSIAGKVLRGRSGADELAINEVYNSLCTQPDLLASRLRLQSLVNDGQKSYTAMEASVDVLFVAFEKFLKVAWRDRLGPVVPIRTLSSVRDKSEVLQPEGFREHFRMSIAELAPQNRRSLKAVIKLLADLLDGASNDGDKGALTASFAECLVEEGNPHEYISLLDRLVEDCEDLFEGISTTGPKGDVGSVTSSVHSSMQARSINTGSLSSNTSSLRRKFGFGTPSRTDSKLESDSRVGSVWRTLSKTARQATGGEQAPASFSKATLVRSKSTDVDGRMLPPPTPTRERPTVLGAFTFESSSRPGSANANSPGPSIPGSPASAAQPSAAPLRKKRRSSLSDLQPLKDSPIATSVSSITPRAQGIRPPHFHLPNCTPTPSPTKDENERPRGRESPSRQENSPLSRASLVERAGNIQTDGSTQSRQNQQPKAASPASSSIPTLKGGRTQTRNSSQTVVASSKEVRSSSPQKLKLQSTQKLRERLQNEQAAIKSAGGGLEAELAQIGEEISQVGRSADGSLHSKANSVRATSPQKPSPRTGLHTTSDTNTVVESLTSRLAILEAKLPSQMAELDSRTAALQNDLSSALVAAETKARKLDELYREANAENEALYERFNVELEKVVGAMKKKGHDKDGAAADGGADVVAAQVKSIGQDVAKWRNEVGRLRRENAGLVARVKGLEEGRKDMRLEGA